MLKEIIYKGSGNTSINGEIFYFLCKIKNCVFYILAEVIYTTANYMP